MSLVQEYQRMLSHDPRPQIDMPAVVEVGPPQDDDKSDSDQIVVRTTSPVLTINKEIEAMIASGIAPASERKFDRKRKSLLELKNRKKRSNSKGKSVKRRLKKSQSSSIIPPKKSKNLKKSDSKRVVPTSRKLKSRLPGQSLTPSSTNFISPQGRVQKIKARREERAQQSKDDRQLLPEESKRFKESKAQIK